MRRHLAYVMAVAAALSATMGWAVLRDANTGADLTLAARAFLDALSADQKATVALPADSPLRLDWHFIPKDQRKGLQIKHMDAAQRKAALALLRSALSQTGYDKATKIMSLEGILRELQKGQSSGPIRDPERYYYTIFGEPGDTGRWALSIEGHHLSLNFAVDQGNVIASTPTFFAANPTVVREGMPGGVPPTTSATPGSAINPTISSRASNGRRTIHGSITARNSGPTAMQLAATEAFDSLIAP